MTSSTSSDRRYNWDPDSHLPCEAMAHTSSPAKQQASRLKDWAWVSPNTGVISVQMLLGIFAEPSTIA